MSSLVSLVNVCGQKNIPGVKVKVHVVCTCDVDVFPDFLATTGAGDSVTLDGDITLLPLKAFSTFEVVADTGELKDIQTGATGSKSFGSSFDFKIPYVGPAATEFIENLANGCFIAIVEEKQGHLRVLGDLGTPVIQEAAEGTTGMNKESERVWTVQWRSETGRPAPYYTGVIDIDPLT